MATSKGMTRREILAGAAGAAAAASVGGIAGCFPSVQGNWPSSARGCGIRDAAVNGDPEGPVQGKSMVVTIQRDDSVEVGSKTVAEPQVKAIQSMVDFALSHLAGGASNPWSKILPDSDPECTRVGLKVNCLSATSPTSQTLVAAVIKNLINKGKFKVDNILVWDRLRTDLTNGNYPDKGLEGAKLAATADSADNEGVITKGPWKGYGDTWGGIVGKDPDAKPRLSRVLTEETDVTINLPVLKAHPESGFTAALKNIYGMFDNPGNFHKPNLFTSLPKLYALAPIRSSIKLTIVDALRASITRDNKSPFDRSPGRIVASLDPLAIDYYGLDLTNQLRAMAVPGIPAGSTKPIDPSLLEWMENAYKLGLGTKGYNLVTLGVDGDVASDGGIVDAASESI